MKPDERIESILHDLRERTKELSCLYKVDEILARSTATVDELLDEVAAALPAGWQFPDVCQALILAEGRTHETPVRPGA